MTEHPKTSPDSPPADRSAEAYQTQQYATDIPDVSLPDDTDGGMPTFGLPSEPKELGTLGPYRVIKELGRGGMGAVYLGFDDRLKRKVALKVMLPKYAANTSAKTRFLREARAAAGITHDHIVTIYEADVRDDTPYMAMQLLQGLPLDDYLHRNGTVPLSELLRIGREIALGLAAAHEVGLVHRDIKPANLWVEAPNGRIKILDFGLAKPTQDSGAETELTGTGLIIGTPSYMSPEQARSEEVDFRADLFSLGIVLYRLATGHAPFHGANVMSMLGSVLADAPTPVREHNAEIPESLARLIHQLLEKKPNQRPKSATVVADSIRQIEHGTHAAIRTPLQAIPLDALPTATKVPTGIDPFADIDATEPGEVVHIPTGPSAKHRPTSKWPLIALGVLLVTLAVLIPQIIKIATPKGMLVIETSDDSIEVVVKKGSAVLHDKTKMREIALTVGDDYQIEMVEKEGLKLSTNKFEITRSGKTVVKVRVEKPKEVAKVVPPVKTPVVASDDRAIGREFIKYFQLTIETHDGKTIYVHPKDATTLPNLPYQITGILTTDPLRGREEFWKHVGQLRNLVSILDFPGALKPTLDDLKFLAKQPNANRFTELYFMMMPITSEVIRELKAFPALLQFGGRADAIDDAMLEEFVQAQPNVKQLIFNDFGKSGKITEKGYKSLARLKLEHFADYAATGVSPALFTALASYPDLRGLLLGGNGPDDLLTDALVKDIAGCQQLTNLRLFSTRITDTGMTAIGTMKNLTHVDFDLSAITDRGLKELANCKNLAFVRVVQCKNITEMGVRELAAALPKCKIVWTGGAIEPKP